MTQGRFGFGVGLSPWPEDFKVTGTECKTRGKRMDEMIAIIRGLMRGGYFAFEGKHYRVPSIKICPVPAEPVPVLIGGHPEPALRRAARLGDGWMHAGGVGLPAFVVHEFRKFLRCGVLAHGFARVRCVDCAFERLVPFSCTGWGFCPSCGGRRMAERATHLVEHVFPADVPVRQWVLSVPPNSLTGTAAAG